jgi:glycosyl transferase family 1
MWHCGAPNLRCMPRALLIARYFPPIGGAGVHRTVGSVRHLAAHGYDVVLVTGPGQQRGRWDFQDPGLLEAIPEGAEVHRIQGAEPPGPGRMLARFEQLAQRPSEWVRWWIDEAVELGTRVGADADVVIVSCAPYETAQAGERLSAALGVPWVADLEDPWALDEMRLHPTGLHHRLDVHRMRRTLRSASAIVMAAPEAAVRVRETMPELADRIVTGIPIGFEPEDFAGITPPPADGIFRIVHTGSMHTEYGTRLRATRGRRRLLGGAFPGVDFLTRSHVFLVEAIAAVLEAEPALRGKVELHLAGDITDGDRAVAAGHDFVRIPGLMPHRDTVALMRNADLLFLPMQDLPAGVRAGLIPYKTYEYLAAGRPILAAVPDGDVRDMLAPLAHTTVVRPADVAAMTAALRERIAAGREADRPAPAIYERAHCVGQIAGVLDGVTGAQSQAAKLAA